MPLDPGPIKPGEATTAAYLDAWAELGRAADRLTVAAPLELTVSPEVRTIRDGRKRPIMARLGTEGPTGCYSWDEVRHAGGSSWVTLAGGRSGTASAWEANKRASLAGKVVELRPGYGGADWRFQWLRRGQPQSTCNGILSVGWSQDCCIDCSKTSAVIKAGSRTLFSGAIPTGSDGINCSWYAKGSDLGLFGGETITATVTYGGKCAPVTFSGTYSCTTGLAISTVHPINCDFPDALTLVDPNGNEVPLSRGGFGLGPNQWAGSHDYPIGSTAPNPTKPSETLYYGYVGGTAKIIYSASCSGITLLFPAVSAGSLIAPITDNWFNSGTFVYQAPTGGQPTTVQYSWTCLFRASQTDLSATPIQSCSGIEQSFSLSGNLACKPFLLARRVTANNPGACLGPFDKCGAFQSQGPWDFQVMD